MKLILHLPAVNRHLHFLVSLQEPDSGNINDVPKAVYQFHVPGTIMSRLKVIIKGWTSMFRSVTTFSTWSWADVTHCMKIVSFECLTIINLLLWSKINVEAVESGWFWRTQCLKWTSCTCSSLQDLFQRKGSILLWLGRSPKPSECSKAESQSHYETLHCSLPLDTMRHLFWPHDRMEKIPIPSRHSSVWDKENQVIRPKETGHWERKLLFFTTDVPQLLCCLGYFDGDSFIRQQLSPNILKYRTTNSHLSTLTQALSTLHMENRWIRPAGQIFFKASMVGWGQG